MDRFTTKENPKPELLSCVYCLEHSNCYSNMSCNEIYNALSKLRYYENLEEQGKLMVLPCKVGDTIYQTKYKCVCTLGHAYLHNTCNSPIECTKCRAVKVERWVIETTFSIDMLDRIGKDFFLTREEAENALNDI